MATPGRHAARRTKRKTWRNTTRHFHRTRLPECITWTHISKIDTAASLVRDFCTLASTALLTCAGEDRYFKSEYTSTQDEMRLISTEKIIAAVGSMTEQRQKRCGQGRSNLQDFNMWANACDPQRISYVGGHVIARFDVLAGFQQRWQDVAVAGGLSCSLRVRHTAS